MYITWGTRSPDTQGLGRRALHMQPLRNDLQLGHTRERRLVKTRQIKKPNELNILLLTIYGGGRLAFKAIYNYY